MYPSGDSRPTTAFRHPVRFRDNHLTWLNTPAAEVEHTERNAESLSIPHSAS